MKSTYRWFRNGTGEERACLISALHGFVAAGLLLEGRRELRQLVSPVNGNSTHIRFVPDFVLRGADRWYAVHTLPRRELAAETQLCLQGFQSFFPRIVRTVRHAHKLRTVQAPAFPRYLFVILDPDRDRWRSVNGTFGVSRILTANDRPDPVPTGVVESLLAATDTSRVLRVDLALQPGQRVRVLAGPFADTIGRLDRLDDHGRVRVLLEIMGGQVPTVLDRRHLAAGPMALKA